MKYADLELGIKWWSKQAEIARAMVDNRRVFVKASHGVGKTHLAAGVVNWFFDCYAPSITLTTAPNEKQVKDVLWGEIRKQRGQKGGLMPREPRMNGPGDLHYAYGYTSKDANGFQGRHGASLLMVFDEATGVDTEFWTSAGMGMSTGEHARWLAICNPTDAGSRAYYEERTGEWASFSINAFEHPNVLAGLCGGVEPYPGAAGLRWLKEQIRLNADPIAPTDVTTRDFEFPPGSGNWYRPGPEFESRVLGRWPSGSLYSVWSDAALESAFKPPRPVTRGELVLGCDVARHGDDFTSIVAVMGGVAIHHETHNGWGTNITAGRLKELCKELAPVGVDPKHIQVKIDSDGIGGGVLDHKDDWNFNPISGAETAHDPKTYPNRRSELWFASKALADAGELDLSQLSSRSKELLRNQLLAPRWNPDKMGRRLVEPKEDTKRRINRSPDDADALNIAFAPCKWWQDVNAWEFLRSR